MTNPENQSPQPEQPVIQEAPPTPEAPQPVINPEPAPQAESPKQESGQAEPILKSESRQENIESSNNESIPKFEAKQETQNQPSPEIKLGKGNCWETLGIDKNASEEVIGERFRTMAMKYHPDHGGNADDFKKLMDAYNGAKKAAESGGEQTIGSEAVMAAGSAVAASGMENGSDISPDFMQGIFRAVKSADKIVDRERAINEAVNKIKTEQKKREQTITNEQRWAEWKKRDEEKQKWWQEAFEEIKRSEEEKKAKTIIVPDLPASPDLPALDLSSFNPTNIKQAVDKFSNDIQLFAMKNVVMPITESGVISQQELNEFMAVGRAIQVTAGHHSEDIQPIKETENQEKSDVQEFLSDYNNLMTKKFGLSVPENNLPQVKINPEAEDVSYSGGNDKYGNKLNIIEVRNSDNVLNGNVIGEEMGHFYRRQFMPDSTEILTDEFFGWMGRRMFYEASKKNDGSSNFFENGAPDERRLAMDFLGSKKMVIDRTKKIKNEIRSLEEKYRTVDESEQQEKITKQGWKLIDEREALTEHYRGYEFATKLDMSKISDWNKFFSMPDAEVRRRFFTDKPDYSGL